MKGKRQGNVGCITLTIISVVFGFVASYIVIILICNWRLQGSINKMVIQTPITRRIGISKVSETFEDGRNGKHVKSPIWEIEYGSPIGQDRRNPVVMIRKSLDEDVMQRFLIEPMFSCEESALNSFEGLESRVKEPIFIYEGYFHSMRTSQPIFSRNPNPLIARDFMKPAATSFVRAFYEAFRVVNRCSHCTYIHAIIICRLRAVSLSHASFFQREIFERLASDLKESAITRAAVGGFRFQGAGPGLICKASFQF